MIVLNGEQAERISGHVLIHVSVFNAEALWSEKGGGGFTHGWRQGGSRESVPHETLCGLPGLHLLHLQYLPI